MSDLSHIVDEMCAWFDGLETASLSTFVETLSTSEKQQPTDNACSFHYFHPFHSENGHLGSSEEIETETSRLSADVSRVEGSCDSRVETVERVERGLKSPAESTPLPFPLSLIEVERVERAGTSCGSPLPDQVHPVFPSGAPLPISSADVHAGVARELRALAEDGREGPDALRDAVEITRAKIRNSEALAERQAHGGRCHVCDEPLDDSAPVVAVLSWSRGSPLFLHAGCHDAYSARRISLVDRIMAAAGYGAAEIGEAA